jgi:acetyltransferase-like isoleucine patch superfamily enzyme
MRKPLVIFGSGDIAQLAHYYFSADSNYDVVAFTLDAKYIVEEKFCDLPVVEFENITEKYSPQSYDIFVAIGYSKLNALRKEKFRAAKEKGYKLASFISSRATVLNEGRIGENCFIFEDNTIQPFVTIGNNVTLRDHIKIGDRCVVGAGALMLADAAPEGVYIGTATERSKVPSTRLRGI